MVYIYIVVGHSQPDLFGKAEDVLKILQAISSNVNKLQLSGCNYFGDMKLWLYFKYILHKLHIAKSWWTPDHHTYISLLDILFLNDRH